MKDEEEEAGEGIGFLGSGNEERERRGINMGGRLAESRAMHVTWFYFVFFLFFSFFWLQKEWADKFG